MVNFSAVSKDMYFKQDIIGILVIMSQKDNIQNISPTFVSR
jgi:hypothetical protein